MNAANIDRSERLRRVLRLLSDGKEHTTRDIMRRAHVCAVNSCVAEINQHTRHAIACRRVKNTWFYRDTRVTA